MMGIYLDNAATSFPKPKEVYDAVNHMMVNVGANPGRGGYKSSLEAARVIFQCREELAELFGAEKSDRIVFTANATEALNIAIKGVLRPGDEVITTPLEHNSVLRPLHTLEKDRNVNVSFVACAPDGSFHAADVERLITPRTKMIVMTHASNVIGTITPVKEIFTLCRERNIITLLDAAQTAGHIPLNVADMNIDLLACSGHKGLFGPQGTGFLYVREGLDIKTLKEGGTGTQSSSPEHPLDMPEHLEAGTLNTPGIAGLLEGIRFIKKTGILTIRERELTLEKKLVEKLNTINKIISYGPVSPEKRASAFSFNLANLDCSEVGFILDEIYDIYVRVGIHCAPLAHKLIGSYPQGTVRVSPGYFNTEGDIDAFCEAVREISKKR